ncbi:OLC1v1021810C1 [Oldenlandia corymbosa var. corymbosa]|uniref:non-specific serine/threonine protein kinase n=1 Tax=Oldenlandia corymbosa var. corymbosa TaxID=529605 RepID=A0AAV1BYT7_OLDCO|nr:OLC1v1021810C1 [Oldenlandia corymbosa var. corymbosa]
MRFNYIYNYSFINNENESYFTYSLYSSAIISRFVVDVSGHLKQLLWSNNSKKWSLVWYQPRQQCQVYAFCGEFSICSEHYLHHCNCLSGFEHKSNADWNLIDFSGGCERKTKLQCEKGGSLDGQKDKFLAYPNMRWSQNPQSVKVGSSAECESSCLNDCSCTAYAYDSNGCSIWNEKLLDLREVSGNDEIGTIYIRVAASEFSRGNNDPALRDQCDYYSLCGSFGICDPYNFGEFVCQCLPGYEPKDRSQWNLRDGKSGCTRKYGEQICGNSNADVKFIKLTSVKVPDIRNAAVNNILGLEECEELCSSNCSCSAYASANTSNGGSGCITWHGDLRDMRRFSNGGQEVYVKVRASEFTQNLKNSNWSGSKMLIIILVPSTAGVLLFGFAIWLIMWKLKGQRGKVRKSPSFTFDPVSSYGVTPRKEMVDEKGEIPVFDLRTIVFATDAFSLTNKLGESGFGSVFKGQLQNGREIAVKRLSRSSGQGIEEFKNETTLIARLQHRNLVKLLGCCIQQEEKMLVYEYLPNKGLDNFIFDEGKRALLDWTKRFEIILGIARGMVYLHRDSRLRIIHRDLKASNVLLDSSMEPKISDFGMARIFGADQLEAKTRRVVGTYGYMSPEYAMQGLFSEKLDVFSYGILLLEIISGKKCCSNYFNGTTLSLAGYVWGLWKEGKALDSVDPAMVDSCKPDEVARCIQIGLLCVQDHANDRPTMSKVLSMLCNETSIASASPKKPAFVFEKVNYYSSTPPCSPFSSLEASANDVTNTEIQAR